MEIFKDIVGYEGLYQVSDLGNIKSLPRNSNVKGNNRKTEKLLKPDVGKHGYKRVSLTKDAKTVRFFIHRLVAEAFIPNPNDKPHINHIDNNPSNNCVNNLEWVTPKENHQYSIKQGRQDKPRQLGCIRAAELNQEKMFKKFSLLYGNNFINTYMKDGNRYVELLCIDCATPIIKRYKGDKQLSARCSQCANKFRKAQQIKSMLQNKIKI